MAGNLSVESCGMVFAPSSRQASSNYGIDSNGKVGMYVPEDHRAWTSSSAWNDQRAVTIEVANIDSYGTVTKAAWDALVKLCVDICKRNGIPRLEFTGDKNGSLTWHCMFASTSCPGNYLKDNTPRLVKEVNSLLEDDMPTVDDIWGYPLVSDYDGKTYPARDLLRGANSSAHRVEDEILRTDDPSGRGANSKTHDHIKWMAAKQAAMDEKLDKIMQKLDQM